MFDGPKAKSPRGWNPKMKGTCRSAHDLNRILSALEGLIETWTCKMAGGLKYWMGFFGLCEGCWLYIFDCRTIFFREREDFHDECTLKKKETHTDVFIVIRSQRKSGKISTGHSFLGCW